MKWRDPIVEEVREIREKLLEKYGGFDNFVSYLRKMESEHKERMARQKEDHIVFKSC